MNFSQHKHFIIAFVIAVIVYAVSYSWIEHRRVRKGAWEIKFVVETNTPAIVINEPALKIENVRITFTDENIATNFSATMDFEQPRQWPYEVPFGKVIFMDTTFLPGNVTFQLFGHEIQLLPRALAVDAKEIAWQSDTNIVLTRKK